MANFQPVVDPKTRKATGYFFSNGGYYKYDPSQGYAYVGPNLPSDAAQPGAPAGTIPQTNVGTSRSAQTDAQKLIDTIFGQTPQEYSGSFKQAYENLSQPFQGRENVVVAGTQTLADVFADRVFQKTGKLPTEEQVRKFVAENLTPGFAEKVITGVNRDQIMAQYVDPHLEFNPEIISPQTPATGGTQVGDLIRDAAKKQDDLYGDVERRAVESVLRNFAPIRVRAAEEEAALGRLRSPVSLAPGSAIPNVDANQANALSDVIGRIAEGRAAGSLGGAQALEALGAGERRASEAQSNFLRNFGLARQNQMDAREEAANNRALQRRGLNLAEIIGRAQAGGRDRDILDYLNATTGAIGVGAKVYTALQ